MTHLKRLAAPKTWRILKKAETFAMRPKPGAHSLELGMPLNTVLIRLGLATNKREVEFILKNKEVHVDGRRVHDEKRPVGLMDVVSIPESDEYYRIVMGRKGLAAIEVDDGSTKPVKITGKTSVKGGKTQINTLDGRNILIDDDAYSVGDSLIIDIPSQDIQDHIALEAGNLVLLYKGRHTGEVAEVSAIDGETLSFKKDGESYETRREYAFVVGKDEAVINLE
jgi:small subunit ribosomal protein S4e